MKNLLIVVLVVATSLLCGCGGSQDGKVISYDQYTITLANSKEVVAIDSVCNVASYQAALNDFMSKKQSVVISWNFFLLETNGLPRTIKSITVVK